MGWTDERVELLKKLWLDGLSASQIAKQLGGITRNAVIGKLHRLGLAGRNAPTTPARTAPKAPRPVRPVSATPSAPRPIVPPVIALQPVLARLVEGPGLATRLTLSARMCKWPIGDPQHDNFTHCGRAADAGPYCAEHAQIAHAPTKKHATANDLARSLRRYL